MVAVHVIPDGDESFVQSMGAPPGRRRTGHHGESLVFRRVGDHVRNRIETGLLRDEIEPESGNDPLLENRRNGIITVGWNHIIIVLQRIQTGILAQLLHVAHAADRMRLLPCLVQCRKKKRRKDRNDRNYYEKFYESKSNFACHLFFPFLLFPIAFRCLYYTRFSWKREGGKNG